MIGRIGAVLALAVMAWSGGALGQGYPYKPIRWISPWPPGGANDILSRALGEEISKALGQPVVVDNRPGATGTIGTEIVAKSPPDGYTVTLGSTPTYATAPSMYPALPYDPLKDFAPITLVAVVPNVLVVHPSLPVGSVTELIAHAKANPGKLNYYSVGSGSTQHLSGEMFERLAGVDMTHVPYKGTGPALTDLLAGRIELAFENMPALLPHIRSGALKPLAVTTTQRSSILPEVPTIAEAGLPGFDVTGWYAVFAPAGTPPEIVGKLNEAVVGALRTPGVAKRLADLGADVRGSAPQEMARYLAAETQRWSAFIKEAGIKLD